MPVFNMGKYVNKAIMSILNSDFKDLEIIVINDGSTDDSVYQVNLLMEKYKNIRIFHNDVNKGAGYSRYAGFYQSVGDYIMTIDADDWIAPDFISALAKKAEETNADVVSGGITIPNNNGGYKKISYGDKVVTGAAQITEVFGEDIVFMNNKLIRRKLFELVPYCNLRYAEDTTTIAPMLYYSNMTVYIDNCGYFYRQSSESLTHRITPSLEALYKAVCAKRLYEFFKDKDPVYKTKFDIPLFIQWANTFIGSAFTDELINNNKELFDEFVLYYIKTVHESLQHTNG